MAVTDGIDEVGCPPHLPHHGIRFPMRTWRIVMQSRRKVTAEEIAAASMGATTVGGAK